MSSPAVSILLPVYNGERYLVDAIESILTPTLTDFELIVIDDGSEDCSPEIIREHAKCDERIRFVVLRQNRGQSRALNRGLPEARGTILNS